MEKKTKNNVTVHLCLPGNENKACKNFNETSWSDQEVQIWDKMAAWVCMLCLNKNPWNWDKKKPAINSSIDNSEL
jgi:hypothetical protein